MTQPVAIFLCDESGIAAELWEQAGYLCYCVDMKHSIRREQRKGNIIKVWGDVRSWYPPAEVKGCIRFMGCFPPCTDVAGSGARDFKTKQLPLLCDALTILNACQHACEWAGCPYFIENPVGVLSSHFRKPDYFFDPCDYGDPYTKKTCLWTGGGFVMPEPNRVEPVMGSMMHTMPPSDERKMLRSKTPRGFARAVFESNCRELMKVSA